MTNDISDRERALVEAAKGFEKILKPCLLNYEQTDALKTMVEALKSYESCQGVLEAYVRGIEDPVLGGELGHQILIMMAREIDVLGKNIGRMTGVSKPTSTPALGLPFPDFGDLKNLSERLYFQQERPVPIMSDDQLKVIWLAIRDIARRAGN
jgi:hypothetical protein